MTPNKGKKLHLALISILETNRAIKALEDQKEAQAAELYIALDLPYNIAGQKSIYATTGGISLVKYFYPGIEESKITLKTTIDPDKVKFWETL